MNREFDYEEVDCCPVCSREERRELFVGRDDRFGHPDSYPVVECAECGFVYLAIRPLEKYVPELYRRYYPSPSAAPDDSPRSLRARCKAWLKTTVMWPTYHKIATPTNLYARITHIRDKTILDVGSGSAVTPAFWIARNGGRWTALETNEAISSHLNRHGFSCHQQTLEQFSRSCRERFDYILLSQVLEHVYHPLEFLKSALSRLTDGGKIIVSCPNYDSVFRAKYGTEWLHWHIPYHVSQFNRASMEVLVQRVGLKISQWRTVTPSSWFLAQQRTQNGLRFSDKPVKSCLILQLCLDTRFRRVNRSGRGDAFVAELSSN